MPTPRHTPQSSTSRSLPPRLMVPPLPPQVHKRLILTVEADGLLLRPQYIENGRARAEERHGTLIHWGIKGKVEPWEGRYPSGSAGVVLGGILGIVRLWDAAYVLVFLPQLESPFPLFSSHLEDQAAGEARKAGPSDHRIYKLGDIHVIALAPEPAAKSLQYLKNVSAKRESRKKRWSLKLPGLGGSGPGAVSTEEFGEETDEETEDDASYEEDAHDNDTSSVEGESAPAPEADESRDPTPGSLPDSDARKRFSAGWGNFFPKLGKGESSKPVTTEGVDQASAPNPPASVPPTVPFATDPPQRKELETKILKQITSEYASGAFFYSLDFDLTHSLQSKRQLLSTRSASGHALANLLSDSSGTTFPAESAVEPDKTSQVAGDDFIEPDIQVPLWRRADRRFFWNEWLMKDFIDAGLHAYIIPVMQGWVQSATFTIPVPPNPLDPKVSLGVVPVDLAIISRRSKDRAGLRYQRRGIDDEGYVANMVETEMIVRAKVEDKVSLFSFVQVRGSIPLKWSQSPYSMKPPPVLDRPVDQTYSIANLHFDDITKRYGDITIINLSEQTGKEAVVTNGYADLVHSLGRTDVQYKDFDFHAKCHGMKWENIAELVKELDFAGMGYLWTLQGEGIREQQGAFRTNCIDCLDRTNVVQSALARHVLSQMLTQLGLIVEGPGVEAVFNDVWANNGDMISLCYAHTSALKGDFVRTGKRDLQGMLHDGVSSISRMFYGAISDFFAQAVISFMLGHRNLGVFGEFLARMESSDASNLIQLSRVRAAAIETSSARVLSDGEHRLAGWTLLCPEERSVKLSAQLEEKVLILTKQAIYVVSFNYSLEKVMNFTRIPLASVTSLQIGAYILSPLQEAGRDVLENYGFIINFSPQNESTRYSTYSIRNKVVVSPIEDPTTPTVNVEHADIDPSKSEFYAFKVLPREFITRGASTSLDDVDEIDNEQDVGDTCKAVGERAVKRIRDQCAKVSQIDEDFIVEKDVVSLAEAQQSTSIMSRVDYAFKRFLWL